LIHHHTSSLRNVMIYKHQKISMIPDISLQLVSAPAPVCAPTAGAPPPATPGPCTGRTPPFQIGYDVYFCY
jgi:hypothetical protein